MFFYRNFHSFDKERFENELFNKVGNNDISFENFLQFYHDILNSHAPLKKGKYDTTIKNS